jgi:Transmembrane domain of unknown function (DUF3566)
VTSGSGESRTLGSGPLFGDPTHASMPRSSAVMPETGRVPGELPGASTTMADAARSRSMTVGSAAGAGKKGRRARLTLKRVDPWSTLKLSFVFGLAGAVVLMVAVIVLYSVVDAMGVITSLRSFLADVSSDPTGGGLAIWLSFNRVMLVAGVLGAVNVVLFTAFATLTAFIYNVCTDIVGGVEVTLAERN